ncbi:TetR/AcrR family transcriptional regulator [Microbacterium sp. No. 7]|uniref:TetR/AcrR family transcriptional regulator n=1 Tax=Microbacterium sp. No. 7 TaxID=1714373 RepID=UPI0006ECF7C5|nr:TetR/AcrR family transcriptional regulator [Microbacterium sp. No. 7]ALJ19716.1 hypothetical protein AOA12_07280 [Microbacterium sp. No. 7]
MSPTREESRVTTRRSVLAAADHLFRERGFGMTTIRDIADASGVSVGTVMTAGDKNALLIQVFDALIEEEHARSAPRPTEGPCPDRILAHVQPFVEIFTSHPDLSRVYASILVSGTHDSELFTRLAALLRDEVGTILRTHGCADAEHAGIRAEAIHAAYVGALFTWSAQRRVDHDRILAQLHRTFAAICPCSSLDLRGEDAA